MGKNELYCDCEVIHEDAVKSAREKILDEETLLLISPYGTFYFSLKN